MMPYPDDYNSRTAPDRALTRREARAERAYEQAEASREAALDWARGEADRVAESLAGLRRDRDLALHPLVSSAYARRLIAGRTPPLADFIREWIEEGLLDLIDLPDPDAARQDAMEDPE